MTKKEKESLVIVLYRLSTSNHNLLGHCVCSKLIVLYRLSTSNHNPSAPAVGYFLLSYIVFLHQTTTAIFSIDTAMDCLISSFYIKPQQNRTLHAKVKIVLYRLSTSNHNTATALFFGYIIVLYRLSTSNHNNINDVLNLVSIVLYRLSTSNHNN